MRSRRGCPWRHRPAGEPRLPPIEAPVAIELPRHVDFFDVSRSNFLTAYLRSRPHIPGVEKTEATAAKGRVTKQGVRDLNYYGPQRNKGAAGGETTPSSPGGTGETPDPGETGTPATPAKAD